MTSKPQTLQQNQPRPLRSGFSPSFYFEKGNKKLPHGVGAQDPMNTCQLKA